MMDTGSTRPLRAGARRALVPQVGAPRSAPSANDGRGAGTPRPVGARTAARWRLRLRDDRGSATAEYAVVILAAVAFAGVLVAVMRSGEVQGILTELVRGALSL